MGEHARGGTRQAGPAPDPAAPALPASAPSGPRNAAVAAALRPSGVVAADQGSLTAVFRPEHVHVIDRIVTPPPSNGAPELLTWLLGAPGARPALLHDAAGPDPASGVVQRLRAWKARQGLTPDGSVDEPTIRALVANLPADLGLNDACGLIADFYRLGGAHVRFVPLTAGQPQSAGDGFSRARAQVQGPGQVAVDARLFPIRDDATFDALSALIATELRLVPDAGQGTGPAQQFASFARTLGIVPDGSAPPDHRPPLEDDDARLEVALAAFHLHEQLPAEERDRVTDLYDRVLRMLFSCLVPRGEGAQLHPAVAGR